LVGRRIERVSKGRNILYVSVKQKKNISFLGERGKRPREELGEGIHPFAVEFAELR